MEGQDAVKVVFYTALFGGHDTLKEFDTGGYDFVAFTDAPVESKTWKIIPCSNGDVSPRLDAKFVKMTPDCVLDVTTLEPGDIVIWIDASITVTDVHKMVAACLAALNDDDAATGEEEEPMHDIAFFKHPERDNIYDEVKASVMLPKYADQGLIEQVDAYHALGLPEHKLYAGGVIARRYGKTTKLDKMWWHENKTRTIQDQLSLPYVLWKLNITPGVIPGSVYGTDFHKHTWTGPEDKPQRRATDLCVCGETYAHHDNHLVDGAPVPSLWFGENGLCRLACPGFTPHPQPRLTPVPVALPSMRTGEAEVLLADEAPLRISVVTPTHNPKWLGQAWESLKSQTNQNFEWVVSVNDKGGHRKPVERITAEVKAIVGDDTRVRILQDRAPSTSVGARKLFAFSEAQGDVLVELDHDDILTPNALEEIAAAFKDPEVGFVYSDAADFVEGAATLQGNQTYRAPEVRGGWMISGFTFYDEEIGGVRPGTYDCPRSLPPTALFVSHIYTAPNHVRAWRRSIYDAVGGHNPAYTVADDHELILRTYLATKFKHVPKPLYLYRIQGENTWARNIPLIKSTTDKLQEDYLERLVLRECELLGVPAFDLGGGLYPRAGWTPVDNVASAPDVVVTDLANAPWPWADGSVGAFRASDLLEHLPDKMQTMREITRCLRPGGWLMSMTPSALGAGAFMDPTHCSYWVPGSFWYYTRAQQSQYIRQPPTFREVHLDTQMIRIQEELVPYVRADLVKL
jgi:glycosyltransferase involved in cell wall biosynthesis